MAESKKKDPADLQFPAKVGEEALEVEKRSVDGSEGDKFLKVFRATYQDPDLTEDQHNRNKDAVLREAINRGLHPRGGVEHVGTELFSENRRGTKTYDVTYSVEVVPASVDHEPEQTTTPATNPDKPQAKEAKRGEVSRDNEKKTDPDAVKAEEKSDEK